MVRLQFWIELSNMEQPFDAILTGSFWPQVVVLIPIKEI